LNEQSLRWNSRTKLLITYILLIVGVEVLTLLVLEKSLSDNLLQELDNRLIKQAEGAARWLNQGGRHPDQLALRLGTLLDAHVTILSSEGRPLGDSASVLHYAGPPPQEVTLARRNGRGIVTRFSPQHQYGMRYVAVAADQQRVVRLGVSLVHIHAALSSLRQRLLLAALFALPIALILAWIIARRVTRPLLAMTQVAERIGRGDYQIEPAPAPTDEFGLLSEVLVSTAHQLKVKIGELIAEKDQLTVILESMVEAVIVLDKNDKIVLANSSARNLLGNPASMLHQAAQYAQLRPLLQATRDEGQKHSRVVEVEGRRSWMVSVQALQAQTPSSLVCVMHDVTELEELETMRRDFIINASHELRTPVATIRACAETLLHNEPGNTREFIEIVHRHAERLTRLIADLLQLSDLEARPRGSGVQVAVKPIEAAQEVLRSIGPRSPDKTLHLEVDPDLVVLCDPDGLEQLLENLVGNAVRYGGEQGQVRIVGYADGQSGVIEVRDDGPGIAEEHLAHLFQRFYRVDAGRSRQLGGTGLGLAIAKQLVESMGGTITVSSQLGVGTTFSARLPRASPRS